MRHSTWSTISCLLEIVWLVPEPNFGFGLVYVVDGKYRSRLEGFGLNSGHDYRFGTSRPAIPLNQPKLNQVKDKTHGNSNSVFAKFSLGLLNK